MSGDINELLNKLVLLDPLVEMAADNQLKAISAFLADRISSPESFVTFLGETSSGKSTLINGLIGDNVLPVKATPTTGAISEIYFDSTEKKISYYAINKNATMEKLDRAHCLSLIEKPDKKLARVRISVPTSINNMRGVRVFDTPGYDSIVDEHEEILKEFLPNSDVVIYTVDYKIGIQENDFAFLGFLKELLYEDAEVILVVNRCPENVDYNNPRIKEIRQYINDILKSDIKCFMVPSIVTQRDEYALPEAKDLWKYVEETVNSERRKNTLYNVFDGYIAELYAACSEIIQNRYLQSKLEIDDLRLFIEEQKKTADNIRKATDLFIIPGFKKIEDQIPEKLQKAGADAEKEIVSEITNSKVAKMDEMISYTNAHLMPYYIKRESQDVQDYISLTLEDMNQQVDDYINKEVEEFHNKVAVKVSTYTEQAVRNIGAKVASKVGYGALLKYFIQFGGKGGANAGIANAASHMLKKVGDVFGKTFSRETHNALKHTLAKIGATSMKAVGSAITVIIELLLLAYEYSTWKQKLVKQVNKAIQKWQEKTIPILIKDLEELKEQNISTINDIANNIESTFDESPTDGMNIDEIEKQMKLCEEIGQKIGVK